MGTSTTRFLTCVWVVLAVGIGAFVRQTADRELVRWHTLVAVGLGGFSMMAICAICPMDVAYTLATRVAGRESQQVASFSRHSRKLQRMYALVYWIGLSLSSLVLPYLEEFNSSGHVTTPGKVLDAARRVAVFFGAMALGVAACLGAVLATSIADDDAIEVAVIAASNTCNALVLACLLGVGLVELPRAFWVAGDTQRELRRAYDLAAIEFGALREASIAASTAAADAIKTLAAVERRQDDASQVLAAAALREDVAALADAGFRSSAVGRARGADGRAVADARRELAAARASLAASEGAVERLRDRIFYLEDVAASDVECRTKPFAARGISWSFGVSRSGRYSWAWHCVARPACNRAAAVATAAWAACLLTSELGAALSGRAGLRASAFAAMARAAARSSDSAAATASLACLSFSLWAAAHAFGLLRLRGYVDINIYRKTPPVVLSFAVRQAGKLAPPLLYNYLSTLHEVQSSSPPPPDRDRGDPRRHLRTAFYRFYSAKLDTLTPGFDQVAACLVLAIAAAHALGVFNRLLVLFKCSRWQFGADVASVDHDQRREGRVRLERDRRRRERAVHRASLRTRFAPNEGRDNPRAAAEMVVEQRDFGGAALALDNDDDIGNHIAARGRYEEESSTDRRRAAARTTPAVLEGPLRFSEPRRRFVLPDSWVRRHARVDATGLSLFETEDVSTLPVKHLDLRRVGDISSSDDPGTTTTKEQRRFAVDDFRLEAADREECERWVRSLRAWRDYVILRRATDVSMV
ncbi:hypothetical protein CTAYLR_005093 [Chrysophaeum taylorii]|uniref:PH domain-containing protein n=1 Tax=Chrysophaeum taylorii TaxID=2483200 RepID=A0AAD7XPE8_9STRA|nr:hypothetical protein CTAYLR_005093 [Chrysophaeum taylorii]